MRAPDAYLAPSYLIASVLQNFWSSLSTNHSKALQFTGWTISRRWEFVFVWCPRIFNISEFSKDSTWRIYIITRYLLVRPSTFLIRIFVTFMNTTKECKLNYIYLHERESFDENFADLQKIFVGYLQSWFYWDLQA